MPAPSCVVVIADASNLERNLFLISQIMETGIPVVIALNMIDVAGNRGIEINHQLLSKKLNIPVVPVVASRNQGLNELRNAIEGTIKSGTIGNGPVFPEIFVEAKCRIRRYFDEITRPGNRVPSDMEISRIILDKDGCAEIRFRNLANAGFDAVLAETRGLLESAGYDLRSFEAEIRYSWIGDLCSDVIIRSPHRIITKTNRIDSILTHRFWGLLVFIVLMTLVFQSIFSWAGPLMNLIDTGFGMLGSWVGNHMPQGLLASLIVNGVIAGVGGVVIFLPQILILFFFIAILEDTGYMSRAAFLMDRLLRCFGLSGKSFIPMLSSFACAVPGIMAARVIENKRDRIATIMVAPLMTCSARLPIYAILIAALIPRTNAFMFISWQGLTLAGLYFLGIITAVVAALIFKMTLLKGEIPPFVMELPSYKVPNIKTVFLRMYEKGMSFLRRAGTIILAMTIIVWALGYFPRDTQIIQKYETEIAQLEASGLETAELEAQTANLENLMNRDLLENSILGKTGKFIEPVFAPLGWDWRISMSTLASFPAREIIVATLGTIFGLGSEEDDESQGLKNAILQAQTADGKPLFTPLVAVSIMVFFALCCQCGATIATIRRETNSWGWAWLCFGYMTVLAYFGALLVYQGGRLLGLG
jgi:ferrous iron transport protein B